MVQPSITYSISYNQYNYAQKLSGKSYVDTSGHTVDCTYADVTFSSSQDFVVFYATAVKNGNDYGFIDDVLVDIRPTNPTGVKLHERASGGSASTNYTFRIYASSLTKGDGIYRIGLYCRNTDGKWNYEYFFVPFGSDKFITSDNKDFQVPVLTTD